MDEQISRYFYEMSEAKNERTTKRILTISGIVIVGLLAIIAMLSVMLYKEHKELISFISDFEFVDESISVESDGDANYIGRDGLIIDGQDNSTEKNGSETRREQ